VLEPFHARQERASAAATAPDLVASKVGAPSSLPSLVPDRMTVSQAPDERPRVLIVDDEKFIRDILADFLGMEGYIVRTAEDGAAALGELGNAHYDLVISDLKMPRMGGIELLDSIGAVAPNALTVIMTGFGTVETAIDAMKRGAYDYILKPFKVEEVIRVVQRGLEKQRLAAENLRLREAVSLYSVSEAIAASLSLEEVLATIGDTAIHELKGDLVSTWLDDGEGGYFERQRLVQPRSSSSSTPPATPGPERVSDLPASGERTASRIPPPDPTPRIGVELGTFAPQAFIDHYAANSALLEQSGKGIRFFATPPATPLISLVSVPLRMKTRLLGWIAVASFTKQKRFSEGNRKLLSIVGSRAAAAIENARLYEDLRATFQQTIQGLARAIDKMDRYTAGHSERVATYATYLAVRLGLPPDVVEIVRQSALMHDIGKIGCVMNLNKPGKLTQDEYEMFKRHPQYGKDILDPIRFLHPLVPGVHLHHERWDGRGYPLGLKGNDVPLIARIIAVADTYDAMTSDRAYRRALPHEVAVGEIERCSGSQFDPEVSHSFTGGLDEFREDQGTKGHRVPD
jgi:response regulator RpfG family c-di-GMP phosphodiesterase